MRTKFTLFDQNHGLTPKTNANFSQILIRNLSNLERHLFYLKHHQTSYQGLFEWKTNSKNFKVFDQNEGYMG